MWTGSLSAGAQVDLFSSGFPAEVGLHLKLLWSPAHRRQVFCGTPSVPYRAALPLQGGRKMPCSLS